MAKIFRHVPGCVWEKKLDKPGVVSFSCTMCDRIKAEHAKKVAKLPAATTRVDITELAKFF